jgi:hypothetical protein
MTETSETQRPLEQRFYSCLSDWKGHISDNSRSAFLGDCLNCDAYRELVSLGKSAMPFIFKEMQAKETSSSIPYLLWSPLVKEIMGIEFSTPNEISGDEDKIKKHLFDWFYTRGV